MKLKDVLTIVNPKTYQVAKDNKIFAYMDKIPTADDIYYQVSQYKNKRSKKRCTMYWPLIILASLFNRPITPQMEENLREFAIKNGYVIGQGNSADQGVETVIVYNNQLLSTNYKNLAVRYEDTVLSPTFDKPLDKGLGIQVSIKASSDFFRQIKAGVIDNPDACAGNLFHIISLFKHKDWYQFIDSDSKHSRAWISEVNLMNLLVNNAIFPRCRVLVPIIKLNG